MGEREPSTYFYVTCLNGSRVAYPAGPFTAHNAALSMVGPSREEAEKRDPWAHFYAFGTASITTDTGAPKVGIFNGPLRERGLLD